MRVLVATSPAELDRLRPAWEHLARSCPRTIFQSFSWNRLAAAAFGEREAPYVVYAESGNGAALIPAALSRDGTLIVFLGETLFDYRTILAAGDPSVAAAAWRELGKNAQQFWVMGIPQPWAEDWAAWDPQRFSAGPCVIAARTSADLFAAAHPRSARQLRRLERQGVHFQRYPGTEPGLARWILQQKAKQLWAQPDNLFSDPVRIEFLAAALALDPLAAEIFTLEHATGIASALITLRDANVRRFYNTYHDERWSKLSPGIALLYETTWLSLAEGLDCDYMTGTQSHKMRFAESAIPLYRIDASPAEVARITSEHEQLLAA